MPAVPPPDVPLNYLYEPHLNEALWEREASVICASQIDAEGQRSEDRLDHLWGQPEWRRRHATAAAQHRSQPHR